MKLYVRARPFLGLFAVFCSLAAGAAVRIIQDTCGPFTDVSPMFCPYVLEAYYTGITAGTSPTTFSPDVPITRGQAAVFTTKALNQALLRGSRRAALGQWWTTQGGQAMGFTIVAVGTAPVAVQSDGKDLWVLDLFGQITRVQATDGAVVNNWNGAYGVSAQTGLVVAMGRIFTTGNGFLYMVDTTQGGGGGTVATVADTGTGSSTSLTFDGGRFWITDSSGFFYIVTPGRSVPWPVQAFDIRPSGPAQAVFDGSNVWFADRTGAKLLKMNADGSVALSVPTGDTPQTPIFDGANLWVPVANSSLLVIRASDGSVLSTLTGNGLFSPVAAAFDGQRILVTNIDGNSVSLWNAASVTPIGTFPTSPAGEPRAACSDGINFWITFDTSQLGRF